MVVDDIRVACKVLQFLSLRFAVEEISKKTTKILQKWSKTEKLLLFQISPTLKQRTIR